MAQVNFDDFYQVPNLKFDIAKLRKGLANILKYKEIDLHGYSLNDANKKVEVVINDSFSRGTTRRPATRRFKTTVRGSAIRFARGRFVSLL